MMICEKLCRRYRHNSAEQLSFIKVGAVNAVLYLGTNRISLSCLNFSSDSDWFQ